MNKKISIWDISAYAESLGYQPFIVSGMDKDDGFEHTAIKLVFGSEQDKEKLNIQHFSELHNTETGIYGIIKADDWERLNSNRNES